MNRPISNRLGDSKGLAKPEFLASFNPAVAVNQPGGKFPQQNRMSSVHHSILEKVHALFQRPDPSQVIPESEFDSLALQIAGYQYRSNPVYRTWCDTRGTTPVDWSSWRQIPTLPTAAFKEAPVTTLAEPARTAVFHSSGTTRDIPSRHFHSRESLGVYEASLLAAFRRFVLQKLSGTGIGSYWIFLPPSPEEAPNSSLVHMMGTIRRGVRGTFVGRVGVDGAWEVDFDRLDREIGANSGSPICIPGTAFQFVHWLDRLGNETKTLPEGSLLLETGGYKGRSRELPREVLHQELSQAFRVPRERILTEYGMSELSSQAYTSAWMENGVLKGDGWLRFPGWVRIRVVSPETGAETRSGEPGLLEIFDLANVASVMALHTGDVALVEGGQFRLLGRAPTHEPRGCSRMSL